MSRHSLKHKIVLITGSSSGIGREAALRFAQAGAIPVLAARSVNKLETLAAEIKAQYGIDAPVFALDVQSDSDVHRVVQDVLERHGRIDILVNNAGFGVFAETIDIAMEDVVEMMDVNYFGLVRMTKAVLPSMRAKRSGQIINIASLASFFATPTHGPYAATKFAVMGFSEGLRFELHGSGVSLSTINPGPVETPFFERANRESVPSFVKFLRPELVADTIVRAAVERKPLYLLPKVSRFGLPFRYLFPRLYDWIMTRQKH
ncbi:MAG: SDR family NAD(P)-dependent oxidoreductase [Tumebacillaceae bacterium]